MRADLKRPLAVALACIFLAGVGFAGGSFISLSPLNAAGHVTTVSVQPKSISPDEFGIQDKRKIEDAVRAELRAIVAQDAKRAFAKLTPSTQSFFGINRAGATTSEVLITDILGQEWLADFEMERQENGDWRVKGCVVQANPGQRA
jgi:hypothetical protein